MFARRAKHQHVRPFIYEDVNTLSLHFSVHEIQSRMRRQSPSALDLRYTRMMMSFLLFAPQPQRIAMVGLGGGSLAKFCHRNLPHACMDVAEVNPHVIALRDEFDIPPDGERFRVIEADGAQFVRDVAHPYDILLLDGFDDQGLPSQLVALSFYEACKRALGASGILVANFPLNATGRHRAVKRLRKVFGADAIFEVQAAEDDNVIVFAFCAELGSAQCPAQLIAPNRPAGMDPQAWEQLLPSFGAFAKAWHARLQAAAG